MKRISSVLILVVLCQAAMAQQQPANPNLTALNSLLGKWVGEGNAEVGSGSGSFSFEASLQNKVLVRKNHSEYRAAKDAPLYVHDDLLIVYSDTATKQLRAFYTDSEGHVINYGVNVSADGKDIVFLSDTQANSAHYRLTYTLTQPDKMSVTLEMAPPDKPDQFKQIVEGKVRKAAV